MAAGVYLMSLVLLASFIMSPTLSEGTLCHRQVLLALFLNHKHSGLDVGKGKGKGKRVFV